MNRPLINESSLNDKDNNNINNYYYYHKAENKVRKGKKKKKRRIKKKMRWMKKWVTSTWGLPGETETHWMQPCCRSSAMRGRIWRATLTEQFSDVSIGKVKNSVEMNECACDWTDQLGIRMKENVAAANTRIRERKKEGGFNSKREEVVVVGRKWRRTKKQKKASFEE